MGILGKLGGRKFLMALFGLLSIALHNWLNIDSDAVFTLGGVIAAFVFGQVTRRWTLRRRDQHVE